MPKISIEIFLCLFCDYCGTLLTHDSMSVRKSHSVGRNHIKLVIGYYETVAIEEGLLPDSLLAFPVQPNGIRLISPLQEAVLSAKDPLDQTSELEEFTKGAPGTLPRETVLQLMSAPRKLPPPAVISPYSTATPTLPSASGSYGVDISTGTLPQNAVVGAVPQAASGASMGNQYQQQQTSHSQQYQHQHQHQHSNYGYQQQGSGKPGYGNRMDSRDGNSRSRFSNSQGGSNYGGSNYQQGGFNNRGGYGNNTNSNTNNNSNNGYGGKSQYNNEGYGNAGGNNYYGNKNDNGGYGQYHGSSNNNRGYDSSHGSQQQDRGGYGGRGREGGNDRGGWDRGGSGNGGRYNDGYRDRERGNGGGNMNGLNKERSGPYDRGSRSNQGSYQPNRAFRERES